MHKSNILEIVETLHPLEIKVIPFLKDGVSFVYLIEKSGLKDVEVMRALQWLQNRGALKIETKEKNVVILDKNGIEYSKNGMPEKTILKVLSSKGVELNKLKKEAGVSDEEFSVGIGVLKKKVAVSIDRGVVSMTDQGKQFLGKESLEERFLKKLGSGEIETDSLEPEEKFAFENLKKRKEILKERIIKTKTIKLEPLGEELARQKIEARGAVDRLTPEILKEGSWKNKKFRKYDIKINVPNISGGRRHFVNQTADYIRGVWLDMGFKEMTGPMLQTSFWNFDALFTAQDHPVRELQDTFYIKNPEKGKLPDKKLVDAVKAMHEHGGRIGSRGWGYRWDPEEAKKNVLRTHTTVLSAKTIAELKKEDLPAKFFSVARCFRNEALDWKHLFELNQVEGIVVDPNANFRNLIGYLKEFFKKLGYEKVRVRPAYFPYTEPSAEIEVFHPVKKEWVELGGSGIFRPEVVVPLLGEDIPVLAWGLGLERSISEYFKITDIRGLYKNDLKQLREIKIWRG